MVIAGLCVSPAAESDAEIIARVLFSECRGEDELGQLAVGQCIVDRRDTDYRDFRRQNTIRAVVTAKRQFAGPGRLTPDLLAVAERALNGERAFPEHEVLFFRQTKKDGDWHAPKIDKLGCHTFYGYERERKVDN